MFGKDNISMEVCWRTGWYVLAYAILAPSYCCPEKAYCEYMHAGSRKKICVTEWVTMGLFNEMVAMRVVLGNKKAADLYGIDPSNFCHMMKKRRCKKWWAN